jgi:hypothetical protein
MLDNLGNVLWLITAVIVVGCLAWGVIARLVARHRVKVALREFQPASDGQLLTGLAELRAAMKRLEQEQAGRDAARDVHRRTWR